MAESESADDQCRVVVDAAMDVAQEKCATPEAARRQMMDLLGFAADEDPPDCEDVLEGGVTPDVAQSLNNKRRYALCRAWNIVENEDDVSFREAINSAWMEIRNETEE